jgi:non-homologous end joining protein Ku
MDYKYSNDEYAGLVGKTVADYKHDQSQTKCAEAYSPDYVIDQLFTYHTPTQVQAQAYSTLREAAKYFAKVIVAVVPNGADRTAAIRKLREAVMTANAGISLNGLSL